MSEEDCNFDGNCQFRNKCGCLGSHHRVCHTTYQTGGILFVDKESHPLCIAKTYFGDAHICLCPAKTNTP